MTNTKEIATIHSREDDEPSTVVKQTLDLLLVHEGRILVRCGRSRFMRMNEDPEEGGGKAPAPLFTHDVLVSETGWSRVW